MTQSFQQQFNEELLRSERRRTVIIMGIFMFASLYRIVDAAFLDNSILSMMDKETLRVQSFSTVWLFPLVVVGFELFSYLYINRRLKRGAKKIPLGMQFLNTVFEISLPSLVILVVANQYPHYDVLKSPVLYIYFIFIILSTLRLNFILSFLCGFISAVSMVLLSIFVYHHFNSDDITRSIIMLLGGTAAGLVAKQIRNGINNSVMHAEKSNHVTNLFGQQISKEVAEKMIEQNGRIESKRMNVAIMFIDIRNFTEFASGRNPEEIVQYQNAFFTMVVDAVSKHGGIVNQFLGDGCMTTFGAPVELQNPSQQAVDAALELLQQVDKAVREEKIIKTKIGIGIHTGEAVTGNIGNAERQQYSITGSVVIMASRIEQLNKKFQSQILVSEDVAYRIGNRVTAELYSDICLKGFDKPVSIYKVA